MALRFNPPPGWPPPPEGFVPPPGWQPDPSWPPAPPGWTFWVPDESSQAAQTAPLQQSQPDQPVPPGQWPLPGDPGQATSWQATATAPPGFTQPPGYGQPPLAGQVPAPYEPWGAPARTNGFAIASLVLGILGLVLAFLGSILGIVFGVVALVQIRNRPPQRGKGLAIAGITVSCLWLVLYVVVIAAGFSTSSSSSSSSLSSLAPSSAPASSASGQRTVNVFSLGTGDCFQNPSAAALLLGVNVVTVVPCTQPHNAQVFAMFPASGSSYPGEAALKTQASQGCQARVGGAVDKSKITSSMQLRFLYPLADTWQSGRRAITCYIADSSRDLTSSLLLTG